MSEQTMITGKKRLIVDKNIFLDLTRTEPESNTLVNDADNSNESLLGGLYLSYPNVDTVRVAVGAYWDYREYLEEGAYDPSSGQSNNKLFDHIHPPLNIFCGAPVTWELCDDEVLVPQPAEDTTSALFAAEYKQSILLKCETTPNSVNNALNAFADQPTIDLNHGDYWIYLMKYGVVAPNGNTLQPIIKSTNLNEESPTVYYDHYHECNDPFTLAELENFETLGQTSFVDYKSFYNNVTSYVFPKKYENFIADGHYQNCLPNIYSFAKITSNQELTKDQSFNLKEIVYGGQDGVNSAYAGEGSAPVLWNYYNVAAPDESFYHMFVRNDVYINLFQYYPLESSITLFGAIGARDMVLPDYYSDMFGSNEAIEGLNPVTFERLLTLNKKTMDATSLINDYLDQFITHLRSDTNFTTIPVLGTIGLPTTPKKTADDLNPDWRVGRWGIWHRTKVGALEYINSNLLFGSNTPEILKKANQYKNYFPMYFELNFTAQSPTLIGDEIKKSKLIRTLATQIAAAQQPYGSGPNHGSLYQSNTSEYAFVDFVEKRIYGNTADPAYISLPVKPDDPYTINTKNVINLIDKELNGAFDKWIKGEDWTSLNEHTVIDTEEGPQALVQGGTWNATREHEWLKDARNYITYIRDDNKEPLSLDNDCSGLFKALFAPAFLDSLRSTYLKKRRTYEDILNGVPAYTEDIFYVIKKFRRDTATNLSGLLGEISVQNVIIPNTSDLNIIEYVDTQVKYGTDAEFRYEVYAYRIVFGTKYKYSFSQAGSIVPIDSNGKIESLSHATEDQNTWLPTLFLNDMTFPLVAAAADPDDVLTYTAKVDVYSQPSIKIIGDKMFSTQYIKILDAPPVPPHVDIVPYRAISNKIKIILAGTNDTFRASPITISNGDAEMFDDIMRSQFSHPALDGDGKVRFTSDDRVAGFQVFRTEQRPKSYSDFTRHPDSIAERPDIVGGSGAIIDLISPNKKYYYTFRTIDSHGHISNPSEVYEVELIDEKGAVKPLIRTIKMDTVENKQSTKQFQKYLLLKLTEEQIHFSDTREEVDSVFTASEENTEINKKRYKMRLTSKGTGKKLDINFSFSKKVVTD